MCCPQLCRSLSSCQGFQPILELMPPLLGSKKRACEPHCGIDNKCVLTAYRSCSGTISPADNHRLPVLPLDSKALPAEASSPAISAADPADVSDGGRRSSNTSSPDTDRATLELLSVATRNRYSPSRPALTVKGRVRWWDGRVVNRNTTFVVRLLKRWNPGKPI